jgi:hypothetical protein
MPQHKLPEKNFNWTPELAYTIGLLTTDGNLSKDRRHITMRSSDIQLLNTFKKCLKLKNKIVQSKNDTLAKKPCYRLQFSNVQFYKWLLKIGIFPNKTYTIKFLKIPDKYFKDFLRGHLDGDGSIKVYKDYYNTFKNPAYIYNRLFVTFISASEIHIKWIRNNIFRLISLKGHLWKSKPQLPHKASIWEVKYAKKESIILLNWIYYKENLPCLKRKKIIAKKILTLLSHQKRKKYSKQKK